MVECHWCGIKGPEEEFEVHGQSGFWCPDCEGFTYFNKEQNDQRRLLLVLEEATGTQRKYDAPIHFKKRLSPLRYAGGKSKMIDYLFGFLREEKRGTFAEVFAGGASLGLSLLDAGVIDTLVLNDIDAGVNAFWETVLTDPEVLMDKISGPAPTHGDFWNAKTVLNNGGSIAEMAWALLIVNRLSFSGIQMAGPLGGRQGTQQTLLSRWNPDQLIRRIQHIHSMADRIKLYKQDAATLIADVVYWDERTTVFADPPFLTQGKRLYKEAFETADHIALAETITALYREFPCADFIVTYDNEPLIRDLYPDATVNVLGRRYSA